MKKKNKQSFLLMKTIVIPILSSYSESENILNNYVLYYLIPE